MQPDVGESTDELAASIPGAVRTSDLRQSKDGFLFVDPARFRADVAFAMPPARR